MLKTREIANLMSELITDCDACPLEKICDESECADTWEKFMNTKVAPMGVEEWVPDCFDLFFVAAGAGESYEGLLGYDSYEQDYFGLSCADSFTEDESKKKLKQMTKDDLIAATRQCFKVYHAYIGLRNRYDSLKAAIDILRDENTGILQVVKEIEKLYESASKEQGFYAEYSKEWKEFERYTDALPREAWIT